MDVGQGFDRGQVIVMNKFCGVVNTRCSAPGHVTLQGLRSVVAVMNMLLGTIRMIGGISVPVMSTSFPFHKNPPLRNSRLLSSLKLYHHYPLLHMMEPFWVKSTTFTEFLGMISTSSTSMTPARFRWPAGCTLKKHHQKSPCFGKNHWEKKFPAHWELNETESLHEIFINQPRSYCNSVFQPRVNW